MKLNTTIIALWLMCVALALLSISCSDAEAQAEAGKIKRIAPVRVRVLDSGTISYFYPSPSSCDVYQIGDTIWVNMSTHRIDDTSSVAQRCVITGIVICNAYR